MTQTFSLDTNRYRSRVLDNWIASRPGAIERTGVMAAENETVTGLTGEELASVLGMSMQTSSGQIVTPDIAMRVATVYACVSIIAGAISTLPMGTYERQGVNRDEVPDHEYWWLFNEQANESMSSAVAWVMLFASKLLHGDGFAELLRPSFISSRVTGWKPFLRHQVTPFRDQKSKSVFYRVVREDGTVDVLMPDDVIHLPSLGFDGVSSPSPITYAAREEVGIGLAAQSYVARFFEGGATFDYALKTEKRIDEEQQKLLSKSLLSHLQSNKRFPLILGGGLEPANLTINSKDAEILATRRFGVEELCRIYGVPPYMVGHTTTSTAWGTGLEQQSLGFVRYTLQQHLTAAAQEFNRKLWPTRARYFVEFNTDALVGADMKSRYEAYRSALGRAGEPGWITPNQVRRKENMPPIEGGDTLNTGAANGQAPAATAQ